MNEKLPPLYVMRWPSIEDSDEPGVKEFFDKIAVHKLSPLLSQFMKKCEE